MIHIRAGQLDTHCTTHRHLWHFGIELECSGAKSSQSQCAVHIWVGTAHVDPPVEVKLYIRVVDGHQPVKQLGLVVSVDVYALVGVAVEHDRSYVCCQIGGNGA